MMKKYFVLAISILLIKGAFAQNLYMLPESFNSSTLSSFENLNGLKGEGGKTNNSAKGNAFEGLKSEQSKVLLEVEGPGIIQRMWFTLRYRSPEMMRSIRLRIYWDGESKAAVDVPFGDFFGYGLSEVVKFESALFSNPEGRSFNCMIPMPFRISAKVVLTNESTRDIPEVFYDIDFIRLDQLEEEALYFHAFWTRQKTSDLGVDFEFLPEIEGKGKFLGVNMGVNADPAYGSTWWGEGEVKMYLDNDGEFPTINGTGTEDYIGTAWGLGQFTNLYQGCTVANDSTRQYAFYRFHIPDIIGFHENFRATIQQIGGGMRDEIRSLLKNDVKLEPVSLAATNGFTRLYENPKDIFDTDFPDGWVNFYRIDDYSATSYFYLNKPSTSLNELPNISVRLEH